MNVTLPCSIFNSFLFYFIGGYITCEVLPASPLPVAKKRQSDCMTQCNSVRFVSVFLVDLDLGVIEAWGLDEDCTWDLGDCSVCRGEQCVWTNGTDSGFTNSSSSSSSGIGTCFGMRLKCDELRTMWCDLLLAVIMLSFFCTMM